MTDIPLIREPLPVGSVHHRATGWYGVMCVILTEAALFAYLLFSYYYFAVQSGRSFYAGPLPELKLSLPNTIILLASSVVAWWGERGIQRDDNRQLLLGLAGSLVLGIAFFVIQCFEWAGRSFTMDQVPYGSLYFTITGFHMAHVGVGVVALAAVLVWAWLGYFDRDRHAPVSVAALYWHFVDAVWLTLFFTFYITPRLG